VERLALAEALRGASPAEPTPQPRFAQLRATLRQVLERQRYSYRHLLCELVPAVRAHLPLPEPLSPGLSLPTPTAPTATAPGACQPRRRPQRA
jgi:hypothetical protein